MSPKAVCVSAALWSWCSSGWVHKRAQGTDMAWLIIHRTCTVQSACSLPLRTLRSPRHFLQMLRNLKSLLWRFLLLAACIDVVTFTLLSSGLSQRTLTAQALFRSRQLTVRFLRGIDPYLEGRCGASDFSTAYVWPVRLSSAYSL